MPWLCMHVGTLVYAVYWLPETGIEYTGNRSCKAGDRLTILRPAAGSQERMHNIKAGHRLTEMYAYYTLV